MASENEMTVPEMGPLTAQEMTTDDNLGLQTLLYVIRGLGVDRDRYMTFAEFADFIQKIFTHVYVYGGVGVETSVKPGEIVGFVGGANFTIKPSLLSAGSSVWGFSANPNKLNYGNATVEFDVDSNGVSFESGSYKAILNARSLKLYKNDNIVFELNDGVIDTLNYKKTGGIIDLKTGTTHKLYEIQEVIDRQDEVGATFKFSCSPGQTIYFDRYVTTNGFTTGAFPCVLEFIVQERIESGETRHKLVPCFPVSQAIPAT